MALMLPAMMLPELQLWVLVLGFVGLCVLAERPIVRAVAASLALWTLLLGLTIDPSIFYRYECVLTWWWPFCP